MACWRASLTLGDASDLASSDAFFHVSPVPAAAKIAPGVILASGGGGGAPLLAHALAFGADPARGVTAPTAGGLLVSFDPSTVRSSADATSLAARWAAEGFGLSKASAADATAAFLPMHPGKGGSTAWRRAAAAAAAADCASLLAPSAAASPGHASFRLTFAKTFPPPQQPKEGGRGAEAAEEEESRDACAVSALAFLASRPEVASVALAPPVVTDAGPNGHSSPAADTPLLRGSAASSAGAGARSSPAAESGAAGGASPSALPPAPQGADKRAEAPRVRSEAEFRVDVGLGPLPEGREEQSSSSSEAPSEQRRLNYLAASVLQSGVTGGRVVTTRCLNGSLVLMRARCTTKRLSCPTGSSITICTRP